MQGKSEQKEVLSKIQLLSAIANSLKFLHQKLAYSALVQVKFCIKFPKELSCMVVGLCEAKIKGNFADILCRQYANRAGKSKTGTLYGMKTEFIKADRIRGSGVEELNLMNRGELCGETFLGVNIRKPTTAWFRCRRKATYLQHISMSYFVFKSKILRL